MSTSNIRIRVGHSPDPDDAFMFHALASDAIDTGPYRFEHELLDIETLNRRALAGELELTAISVHAFSYVHKHYALCNCGASMGDGYGPMVVARDEMSLDTLRKATIAVPGTMTTAYLSLRLCLDTDFSYVVVPFDEIIEAVQKGQYGDQRIDAGLIIHEGQLTYGDEGLKLIIDMGAWWLEDTGLPLPLGANAIRRDLGPKVIADVYDLLLKSIQYGLDHRAEALDYAMKWGRGLDTSRTDRFVDMYVNKWTLDFGERGRRAVAELLRRGYESGVIPELIDPDFVGV